MSRRRFPVSEVFRKDSRPLLEDPYRQEKKYRSNTLCPACGLLFQNGRWKRARATGQIQGERFCPACLRTLHDYPGGVLRLSGSFLESHREEILQRIRNLAAEASKEHPLERIIRTEEKEAEILVYSTSEHLVARLGKAIRSDFSGTLDLKYDSSEKYAMAHWTREG